MQILENSNVVEKVLPLVILLEYYLLTAEEKQGRGQSGLPALFSPLQSGRGLFVKRGFVPLHAPRAQVSDTLCQFSQEVRAVSQRPCIFWMRQGGEGQRFVPSVAFSHSFYLLRHPCCLGAETQNDRRDRGSCWSQHSLLQTPLIRHNNSSVLAALEDYSITSGLLLTLWSSRSAGLCMNRQATSTDGTQHPKEKRLCRDKTLNSNTLVQYLLLVWHSQLDLP